MIPMLGFIGSFTDPSASLSEPLDLYLHGYISSRLMRLGAAQDGEEEGLPLTIAATHLDGLVLALTPNHHSYNYRSAMYVTLPCQLLSNFPNNICPFSTVLFYSLPAPRPPISTNGILTPSS